MTNFTFQLQGRGYRIRGNKNAQWHVGVVSQPKTRAVFGTLPEALTWVYNVALIDKDSANAAAFITDAEAIKTQMATRFGSLIPDDL